MIKSPLRYPGGKSRALSTLKRCYNTGYMQCLVPCFVVSFVGYFALHIARYRYRLTITRNKNNWLVHRAKVSVLLKELKTKATPRSINQIPIPHNGNFFFT